MDFAKPSPAIIELFDAVAPHPPVAERRKMFGMPCCFANNGQMAFGVYGDSIMLRLSEADRAEIAAKAGATPFEPMPGRVMKEYVAVPPALLADRARLNAWLARSLAYAESLPAKVKKAKKKAAGGKAATRAGAPKQSPARKTGAKKTAANKKAAKRPARKAAKKTRR